MRDRLWRPRGGDPFSPPGPGGSSPTPAPPTHTYMKADAAVLTQEPVGIVISRGADPEPAPAMFAYMWAPAPEPSEEPRESKVA